RAKAQGVEEKLPRSFDAWFARCLHRDPPARYANADLAWRALRRVFEGTPVLAEAFAETSVDPSSHPPPKSADETGASSPYVPAKPVGLPPETPIASTRDPTRHPPPATKASRAPIVIGGAIAIAGL